MSSQFSGPMPQQYGYRGDWRMAPSMPAPRRDGHGIGIPLVPILGLAALGLAVAGGLYFAPDLIRYMKIRNM